MSKQQRKFVNNFIDPKFQFKMVLYFSFTSLAIVGVSLYLIINRCTEVLSLVEQSQISTQMQAEISARLVQSIVIAAMCLVVSIANSVLFGLIYSHRIAGPMRAILAFIEELKEGNYDVDRSLRPNDELGPIMAKLKELRDALKSKRIK